MHFKERESIPTKFLADNNEGKNWKHLSLWSHTSVDTYGVNGFWAPLPPGKQMVLYLF